MPSAKAGQIRIRAARSEKDKRGAVAQPLEWVAAGLVQSDGAAKLVDVLRSQGRYVLREHDGAVLAVQLDTATRQFNEFHTAVDETQGNFRS